MPHLQEKKRAEFDAILEEYIASLPNYVRTMLEEVPVLVEDEPSVQVQKDMNAYVPGEPSDLCGMHYGIPITEQSHQASFPLAPVIMIFRGPIIRLAEAEQDDLRDQIRITLLHEIGHHFGMDEDELEEIGYG